jgi:hypothetical protein
MLFQVGLLTIDRRPFNVAEWSRDVSGDHAKKDLLGRRPGREFVGKGEETITLKGTIHPLHYGGLSELELAQALSRSGLPLFVTRGDGAVLGWYAIEKVSEKHAEIVANSGGVGAEVEHEIKLIPVDPPGADIGSDLLSSLVSLFG